MCVAPPVQRLTQVEDKTSQRIDFRIARGSVTRGGPGEHAPTARDSAQLLLIKFDNIHRAALNKVETSLSRQWILKRSTRRVPKKMLLASVSYVNVDVCLHTASRRTVTIPRQSRGLFAIQRPNAAVALDRQAPVGSTCAMAPRIPSSLRWLIDKRARLEHEMVRLRQVPGEAKLLLQDVETALVTIDRALQLHDVRVDVENIKEVRSIPQAKGKT
jgi:hypothetical protein